MKKYGKLTKKSWDGCDSESLFDYHYEKFPEFFQTYKDNPIEYVLSAPTIYDGPVFRTAIPFEKDKKLKVDIFLGCSHTYGVGHHEKNIWVAKVTEKTGNTPVNLGSPGRGTSQSYINLVNYADLWDVQNIFHYQPYYPRYDNILLDYKKHHRKPHEVWATYHVNVQGVAGIGTGTTFGEKEVYTRDYIETTMVTERYMKHHHNKHIYACAGYAASKSINYYHLHSDPSTHSIYGLYDCEFNKEDGVYAITNIRKQEYVKTLTLPRDGTHRTVETHQEIGEEFLKMYNTVKNRKRVGGIEPLHNPNAKLARKLTRENSKYPI